MAKPTLLTVDDDPNVLKAIEKTCEIATERIIVCFARTQATRGWEYFASSKCETMRSPSCWPISVCRTWTALVF